MTIRGTKQATAGLQVAQLTHAAQEELSKILLLTIHSSSSIRLDIIEQRC